MDAPIIRLRGIGKDYVIGDEAVSVLRGIDLDIWRGDYVAIIGASGSGKSTLMNLIGCLDHPTRGSYAYDGQDVSGLDNDALAKLRREHFGFIFQRYQLLGALSAVGNVEIPAIYAGTEASRRQPRAEELLTRLGLGNRLHNRPSQLSGGQQQRVSVARALMNGGEVILADEPTGALDSVSGTELLHLFDDLHRRGHTIVVITHDPDVAARASRIIQIRDGAILSDSRPGPPAPSAAALDRPTVERAGPGAFVGRLGEAARMAVKALAAHRLRSFLTMLGIIIGIASVVSVVALGKGSQEKVLSGISALGTNTITIRPGTGFGDRMASRIRTLVVADAVALAAQPFTASVSPEISTQKSATLGAITTSVSLRGVSAGYFDVGGFTLREGMLIDQAMIDARAQVAVLDAEAYKAFFPQGGSVLGKTILIGKVPLRIIGRVEATSSGFGPTQVRVFTPFTTASVRITGSNTINSIAVKVADTVTMADAEGQISALIEQRHGKKDFFLQNADTIRNTITQTTQTMTILVAAIALISLVVGGIGVMNIMLVSVTERTAEIGVRVAVGARRSDIVAQFLIEAVLICLLGGLLGVALALAAGQVFNSFQTAMKLSFSAPVAALAFLCSSLIGVSFGFLPARAAAKLDPVEALARD
ncbi:MacB family efflux pump subunit [Rhodobacter capsulatus]|uniref:Pyoverdine export ATP-binding/permease protein PvdT n=1 Tax=Rhodobacter capsulatus (strain ATCC BAA-309 / NBRC 16581 / SB1003) TaxID=272942 RepID=D5AM52_RHOCB|nr:MacB family efflux pump subunit [Rhodobacter capsulatus]ADE84122.1 macrolide export ABC transporter, ATP-binding/permease protein MacB [Rhodobacter capsulatus SB 1003]ETD03230.1 ABC transporter [Rhodobacter capsulatus DE442]ETD79499.1 ABC transporter [Rhodobacter capsulatus R121]ETD82535.1 ABC transporter [Rhodobacter capsulatus B6]ETE55289.1 ABC transporter [Rhodobacter capsulatus Y262]